MYEYQYDIFGYLYQVCGDEQLQFSVYKIILQENMKRILTILLWVSHTNYGNPQQIAFAINPCSITTGPNFRSPAMTLHTYQLPHHSAIYVHRPGT